MYKGKAKAKSDSYLSKTDNVHMLGTIPAE